MHSRIAVPTALIAFLSGIVVGSQILTTVGTNGLCCEFFLAEFEAIVADMDAEQRTTVRLLEGGSCNVNIWRIRSGETALMHLRTTDVYVVREGSGVLVTGGRIADESGRAIDGQRGSGIIDGTERQFSAGYPVLIPAGVPHGIRETDGITWFNIRFDTRS